VAIITGFDITVASSEGDGFYHKGQTALSHSFDNKKGEAIWHPLFVMVGRARFERATNWLKANCSTD
jgi:hypothetical protein